MNRAPARFPWVSSGFTFRDRAHLERIIEQLAGGGTSQHLTAAHQLMNHAIRDSVLTTDQYNDLKKRLHL